MSSRLARSAGLISVATMASRVLGVARETVLAATFGAASGPEMDAFNVAFRVPNLLRDLFAEGAMTAAFVPTFTRDADDARPRRGVAARQPGHQRAARRHRASRAARHRSSPSRSRTHGIAPEFASVPGKLELTTQLTRIMLPFLTTVAVAVAMMGMFNSLHRFFIPALSPAMFNVATIVCAFALVPLMPRFGLPPIAGDRHRHAFGRARADRCCSGRRCGAKASATSRSSTSAIRTCARSCG